MNSRISVACADDHYPIRMGVESLIKSEPKIVLMSNSSTIDELIYSIEKNCPDVIVTDLSFYDSTQGDIRVIEKILRVKPDAKILVYSMRDTYPNIIACYKAGVKGFLSKTHVDPLDLTIAIKMLHKGETYVMEEHRAGLKAVSIAADPLSRLTPRHRYIFLELAKGINIEDVANDLNCSVKTIQNTISKQIKITMGGTATEFPMIAKKLGIDPYIDG